MKKTWLLLCVALATYGCNRGSTPVAPPTTPALNAYFDSSGRDDALSGGVRMIPINTPKGTFRVWTKRVGNNPTVKVLLLHGSHMALYDDQKVYMEGLIQFIKDVDAGNF